VAVYQAHIVSSEAAGNGDVHLDVYIQKEVSPDVWETVPNGHRAMVLNGAAVLAITEGPGSEAEKQAAIVAIMQEIADAWGIGESDDANEQLTALVPGGWPCDAAL